MIFFVKSSGFLNFVFKFSFAFLLFRNQIETSRIFLDVFWYVFRTIFQVMVIYKTWFDEAPV